MATREVKLYSKHIIIHNCIMNAAPNSIHFGTALPTPGLRRVMRDQETLRSAILQLFLTGAGSRQ